MAHLVTRENSHLYQKELGQMYGQRHEVFVDDMGWELPLAKGGLEKDQYDDEDTVYILSLDENDNVQGSMRLLPTTEPHLMSDHFLYLLDTDEPVGPTVWESSRTCVAPSSDRKGMNRILSDVYIGMTEAALILGIEKISFVANMQIYPSILQGGWGVFPLGLPRIDKTGEELIAAYVTINSVSLQNVRQNRDISHPVLNFTNPQVRRVA